jgi:hypothetical protein
MARSLFAGVELAPRDPILGLTEAFNADPRPAKVNLGVGVYTDDEGKIPLLQAVRAAEERLVKSATPRGYQPIEGAADYGAAVQRLLFGADSTLPGSGHLVTAQALGGTGALRIGADFLKRIDPNARVLISDPSWENHRALFEAAGFPVGTYPYYDAATQGLNFDGMGRSSCCTRAATTRRASIYRPTNGTRSSRSRASGNGSRSLTWRIKALPKALMPTARSSACLRTPGSRFSSPARSRSRSRSTASASAR